VLHPLLSPSFPVTPQVWRHAAARLLGVCGSGSGSDAGTAGIAPVAARSCACSRMRISRLVIGLPDAGGAAGVSAAADAGFPGARSVPPPNGVG
jgi:hypothetical protein